MNEEIYAEKIKNFESVLSLEEAKEYYNNEAKINKLKARQDELKAKMLINIKTLDSTKAIECEYLKVTYVAPFVRVSLDTEQIKKDGLYDKYATKLTTVAENIKITIKANK